MNEVVRKNKNVFILFILMLGFVFSSYSQKTGFSDYSKYGIGTPERRSNNRGLSLGGVGQTLTGSNYFDLSNPATSSSLEFVTIELQGSYSVTSSESDKEFKINSSGSFDYVTIGIPLKDKKWGMGFGIKPVFSSNFNFISERRFVRENINYTYFVNETGNGSANHLFLNSSYKIIEDKLSVGLTFSYVFGNLKRSVKIDFHDSVNYLIKGITTKDFIISGVGIDIGGLYTKEITDNKKLKLGLTITPPIKIKSKNNIISRQTTNFSVLLDTALYVLNDNVLVDLPLSLKMGLGYEKNEKWGLYSDLFFSNWKSEIEGVFSSDFNPEYGVSAGYEWTPRTKSSIKYSEFIKYRFGAYYNKTYLTFNNNNIIDIGLTLGIELPIKNNKSLVSFVFNYGQKGKTANNLLLERYFKFGVSINFSDKWFQTRIIR